MTQGQAAAVMISVGIAILIAMAIGWARRSRRDQALHAPTGDVTGDEIATFATLYVATTEHEKPLERLAIRHLAFRAKAAVTVTTEGIALAIAGEPTVFVPREQLVAVGRATFTIDRVVERDGLVFFTWHINDTTVADSYLRVQQSSPADLLDALQRVIPTPTATGI